MWTYGPQGAPQEGIYGARPGIRPGRILLFYFNFQCELNNADDCLFIAHFGFLTLHLASS